MSGMNKIIVIHGASPPSLQSVFSCADRQVMSAFTEEDSDIVCQPGVGWMEINEVLKEKGIPLFFPVRAKP
jgi:D-lactate dehydrogenase (cytochrome)